MIGQQALFCPLSLGILKTTLWKYMGENWVWDFNGQLIRSLIVLNPVLCAKYIQSSGIPVWGGLLGLDLRSWIYAQMVFFILAPAPPPPPATVGPWGMHLGRVGLTTTWAEKRNCLMPDECRESKKYARRCLIGRQNHREREHYGFTIVPHLVLLMHCPFLIWQVENLRLGEVKVFKVTV